MKNVYSTIKGCWHSTLALGRSLLFVQILLLLLMLAGAGSFFLKGLTLFYQYQKIAAPDMEFTWGGALFFMQEEVKRDWLKFRAPSPRQDEESPLTTFDLVINQRYIDQLNVDLPFSGNSEYVEGHLSISDDPQVRKVDLRYRGDTSLHWLYRQKSLRIKLPGHDLYNLEAKFNLINPPREISPLVDGVTYKLCRQEGILAPDYFPVRVFINGRFMGVYSYLSQINESTLRKAKRMPGSIYAGDGVARDRAGNAPAGWYNEYGVPSLWEDAGYWKKVASRNSEQKADRRDISFFIDSIKNSDEVGFFRFVNRYISKENYFKYMALEVMMGGGHHDYGHNHKIYFDPYIGKFEPIQWDFRNWYLGDRKDISNYPLLHRIKLNPLLESERDGYLYDLMNKYVPAYFMAEVEKLYEKIRRDLQSDFNRDTPRDEKTLQNRAVAVLFSMAEFADEKNSLLDRVRARRKLLDEILADAGVAYDFKRENRQTARLLVKVDGNSAVELDLTDFLAGPSEVRIYRDLNFNNRLDRGEPPLAGPKEKLYPGRKVKLRQDAMYLGREELVPAPLYYAFIIVGDPGGGPKKISAANLITGAQVVVEARDIEPREYSGKTADSVHPWLLPEEEKRLVVFRDRVAVNQDLVFDESTTVRIDAGTTFIMAPGASIFFQGRVLALGTGARPIRFMGQEAQKPWGVVAVQGRQASNSVFRFVEFVGGSVAEHNLIQYTAPFNIHDVDWFEVNSCRIGRNFIGDDAMHVAYAHGTIEKCLFENARSDALDVDIADITVSQSFFYQSGNDAIDLMSAKVLLQRNVMLASDDKGVSIGEWSEVAMEDNILIDNDIAIEIKDKSRARVDRALLVDARRKALNLYNKNERYDEGGFLQGAGVILLGNETVTADRKSKVALDEQPMTDEPAILWYENTAGREYHHLVRQALAKHDR
jgi:hypothetical protein